MEFYVRLFELCLYLSKKKSTPILLALIPVTYYSVSVWDLISGYVLDDKGLHTFLLYCTIQVPLFFLFLFVDYEREPWLLQLKTTKVDMESSSSGSAIPLVQDLMDAPLIWEVELKYNLVVS